MKEPTRITETKSSLIDVVMCTDPTLADSCSVIAPSISDHNLVEVTLRIRHPKVKAKYASVRSYSRYTSDSFFEDLFLVPWHMVHFFDDIDSQIETFNSLVLEVLDQFVEFLTTNDKLSLYQSGNRKMQSTETALINVSDNLLKAIDEKSASLLVLLDMSKAFDSLNHNLLLEKLLKFSSFLV